MAESVDGDARTLVHQPAALARTEVSQDAATLAQGAMSSTPPEVDPAPAPLAEPTFDARYEDRLRLGEGGMGEVRLVKDRRIGREIALKVIRAGSGSRSDARVRFEREARVQGQLEHPSVVPVYDLGIRPDGSAFFTMKRVRGETLEDVIDKLRKGDEEAAATHTRRKLLGAFSSLCLAVAFAHSRRVLHRDLKPGNIMLGAYGELYILDWGLAKVLGSAEPTAASEAIEDDAIDAPLSVRHRTVAGSMMGTPGYMSPEQIRGEIDALDERTDVFSLGCILFELLTLEPLFGKPGDTVQAVIAATLRGADARASVRAPDRGVPPELDAICARATASEVADRFGDARALHEAVERFLDGDRDLEHRRAMAARHVERAEELFAEAERDEAAAPKAQEEALREASAALAIDPAHRGAIGLMVRLLLDAPLDLPPEARAELDARAHGDSRSRRGPVYAYATFLTVIPSALLLGVRSMPPFITSVALAVITVAAAIWASRRPIVRTTSWLMFALSTLFIISLGAVMGPFILLPGMLSGNAIAFVALGDRRDRGAYVGLSLLALALPLALDLAGVLPGAYRFSEAGMLVVPHMAAFPRVPTLTFLLLGNALMVLTPALLFGHTRDALARNEERLFAYAWRLRQLLPMEARRGALPGAPEEPEAHRCADIHERLRIKRPHFVRPSA